MKLKTILFTAGLLLTLHNTVSAATAIVRMYCQSIQFERGYDQSEMYSIDVTALEAGVNGELAPLEPGGYTHGGYFILNDHTIDEEIAAIWNLDTPGYSDVNDNGFDDFFEVDQGVPNHTSSGAYYFIFDGVTRGVSARWQRAAGSASGSCVIELEEFGTYTLRFTILEVKGTLDYTPGLNSVSGKISMQRTEPSALTFNGPLNFVKTSTNPFNQLTNQVSVWTNHAGQPFEVFQNIFQRDPLFYPTNYFGYLEFVDGEPATDEEDYYLWILSIDEEDDADNDGIPDFSDDPIVPVRRPELLLTDSGTNLLLTISGEIGRLHRVQTTTNLVAWSNTIISATLTNDPQTVAVPYPTVQPRYWRVAVE